MKKLITLLFITTIIFTTNAQNLSSKDSTAILFKSKLFTVSEYGIGDEKQIIEDIENQKAVFLKTFYENFVFVKVDFSQQYRKLNQSISTLNRDCSYYLAFSILDSRFYKLGGFDTIDIDDFFNDLKLREKGVFNGISGEEVDEIDIYCLYDYFEWSKKKRKKKGFSCFKNCNKLTKTQIILN